MLYIYVRYEAKEEEKHVFSQISEISESKNHWKVYVETIIPGVWLSTCTVYMYQ